MTNIVKEERVVVVGATGYLGRHVVAEFARRGHHVSAVVRKGKTVPGAHRIIEADVTQPATLAGALDGAALVFSALGITRQTDKVTYEDIEYTANHNVLHEAARAGVKRFGVISAVNPDVLEGLAIMESRERFIAELSEATVPSTVVRATGFFSDLQDVFDMAASGRSYVIGDGTTRVNPVHGEDLAAASADAMLAQQDEIDVGGPEVFTWNEVAQTAFAALGTPAKITHVPAWVVKLGLPLIRPFNRRVYDVGSFIVRGATHDMVAPCHGQRRLAPFFETLARAHSTRPRLAA
ncbi:MAG: NAD(P)H-binding protein [Nannocystales bacterium]